MEWAALMASPTATLGKHAKGTLQAEPIAELPPREGCHAIVPARLCGKGRFGNRFAREKCLGCCYVKIWEDWSHPPGLNRRPADYESAALPAELGWRPSTDNDLQAMEKPDSRLAPSAC